MTSTFVANANHVPQYIKKVKIEGLDGDEGAQHGRWNGYHSFKCVVFNKTTMKFKILANFCKWLCEVKPD